MDSVQNAQEYTQSAFAIMGIDYPLKENGNANIPLALGMCCHWAARIEQVATLAEWLVARHADGGQGEWSPAIAWPKLRVV